MATAKPGAIHQHFKGADKRYYVLCTAVHTETKEELVIYIPLYGENAGVPLARPKKMWEETVEMRKLPSGETYSGDRFWPESHPSKPNLG